MNIKRWIALGAGLAVGISLGFLMRHDREYFWLIFGQKGELPLLAFIQDDHFYLDRNGDGRFDGPGEQLGRIEECKDVVIQSPDGQTVYTLTGISKYQDEGLGRDWLMLSVSISGPVSFQQYGTVETSRFRTKAPVVHFDGPMTVGIQTINWKVPPDMALRHGPTPLDLRVWVGTFDEEKRCWVVVRSHMGKEPAFPTNVFPVVEIEFPPAEGATRPIIERYNLKEFC